MGNLLECPQGFGPCIGAKHGPIVLTLGNIQKLGAVMWEYLVVRLHINKPDHVEKTLNDWGHDGWELVTVCWQIGWSTAYFKSPKTLRDDEV